VTTREFLYTGAGVGFTVPLGVTSLTIEAWGASGGGNESDAAMANGSGACMKGGHAKGTITVSPGTICYVHVGGQGDLYTNDYPRALGGYAGGGHGTSGSPGVYGGGGGGGYTDFRISGNGLANQAIVAGGGGGLSAQTVGSFQQFNDGVWAGGDASVSAGGTGGTVGSTTGMDAATLHTAAGVAGTRATGASAPNPTAIPHHAPVGGTTYVDIPPAGGGGGGGYYGGGSGAWAGDSFGSDKGGHGGGGSNFIQAGATGTINTPPALTGQFIDVAITTRPVGRLLLTYSLPPNAPAPALPFNNSKIDNSQSTTFQWTNPAVPEPGMTITGYEIQYRNVGDTDWTSLGQVTSTATTTSFAAGTFDDNTTVEWQVRSKGSLTSQFGPWSVSYYFEAIAPPPTPTITSPTAGATIASSPQTLSWTPVVGQQQWQARRCSTSGQTGGTVYWDSGINADPASSVSVPFDTVTRTDHLQVRVLVNDLWSQWADVSVSVAIVPPTAPTIAAVGDSTTAKITVTVTNPAGGVAVDHNDIYRSAPGVPEVRVATGVAANGSWVDMTPASKIVYSYRAVAVAATGAGASS
jgi:hypothetical protein